MLKILMMVLVHSVLFVFRRCTPSVATRPFPLLVVVTLGPQLPVFVVEVVRMEPNKGPVVTLLS